MEALSRNEEKGWILEDGRRIISFRLTTFQAMFDELKTLAGNKVAEVLLHRLGAAIGYSGMSYSKDTIQSENDLGKVFDKVVQIRGWGRCVEMHRRNQNGKTVYEFVCSGTPLTYERVATEPTCYMMRGVIVGWLEAYLGKKAVSYVERQCASMGSPFCVFEVTFESR